MRGVLLSQFFQTYGALGGTDATTHESWCVCVVQKRGVGFAMRWCHATLSTGGQLRLALIKHTMATAPFLTALTPATWTLTDPEKRANGSASAWVNSADGGRPTFQALRGDLAFEPGYGAASEQQAEDVSEKMLKLELNVRPDNADAAEFTQACDRADQTLVQWGAKNSQKLFRQQLDAGMVSKLLRPLVKASPPSEPLAGGQTPKSYPPRFRVKVNTKEVVMDKEGRQIPNARKTQVFVVNSETTYRRGTVEDLRRGCEVVCIVEIPSAWISGMFFGFNVVASKILVFPGAGHNSSALTFNLPTPMVMDTEQPQEGAAGEQDEHQAGDMDM